MISTWLFALAISYKENDMSLYGDRAVTTHAEGFNCAQSVVASLCEEFGVDRMTAYRFAGAFGSGIGHLGATCGAVTGAVMLIGLAHGKEDPRNETGKAKSQELATEFFARFREKMGCLGCSEILGGDINTPEGQKYIEENGTRSRCDEAIRAAAEIVRELL